MLEKTRDNEIHVEMVEEPPAKSIAFGLERIGLIPMKAPILSCIILVGLIIGSIFGIDRIKIDDTEDRADDQPDENDAGQDRRLHRDQADPLQPERDALGGRLLDHLDMNFIVA